MVRTLNAEERARTASWIAGRQHADGSIPWLPGRKWDAWDHVQCAMSLALEGYRDEAVRAFRFLTETQDDVGGWPAMCTRAAVFDSARDTNHAAYVAAGLWYLHRCKADDALLEEMWPMVDRAIEFVVGMQCESSGVIWWSLNGDGEVDRFPLLTGSASVHGSLVCAERIAAHLGHDRPRWKQTRLRLAEALRNDEPAFAGAPQSTERFSMDWYYPVLGGAIRGDAAIHRFEDGRGHFVGEGLGCRCVRDRPWYTVAETCELIMGFDAAGLTDHAWALYEWTHSVRCEDGGYWIGVSYPNQLYWPPERPTWTAATVLMATDVLDGESPTSTFFRELAGD